jgi:hypothetical protein
MTGWCESELHPEDTPGGVLADEGVEVDAYMCRAGQYAPGVPAMDEDRFVWLCETHRP